MTKSRARGPKRRAPGNKGTDQDSTGGLAIKPAISTPLKSPVPSPSPKPTRLSSFGAAPSPKPVEVAAMEAKSPPSTPDKPPSLMSRPSQENTTATPDAVKAKPITPAKSPALVGKEFKANGNDLQGQFDGQAQSPPPEPVEDWTPTKPRTPYQNKPSTPSASPFVSSLKSRMAEIRDESPSSRPLPQPPSKKLSEEAEGDGDEVPVSVRQSAALWGSTNSTPDTTPRKPIPLPTAQDESEAMEVAGLRSRQTPSKSSESRFSVIRPDPPSRISSRESVVIPVAPKPNVITSDPEQFLAEFFTSPKIEAPKFDFDTSRILEVRADDRMEKVHTSRKEMWEITGINFKKEPVLEGQDHILYEDGLYLVLHTFMDSAGATRTEFYLWYGEKVSLGTVEEAQLFAKNMARENGGRLVSSALDLIS